MKQPSSTSAEVRAIDVGYFSVKYTLGRKQFDGTSPIAMGIFPALAPTLDKHVVRDMPGSEKVKGWVVEVGGENYFVGPDSASSSNGKEVRTIPEDYSVSPKYLALARGALADMAADAGATSHFTIAHLVVGLPLHTFGDYRRELALRLSGEHHIGPAGGPYVRVQVDEVSVIVQPHGALLNYGVNNNGKMDGLTLVVDVGGGTVDWYCADKQKTYWARCGAYNRAMLACAQAVADQLRPGLRDQIRIVANIDEAIRKDSKTFRAFGRDILLDQYQAKIDEVLNECAEKMLSKAGDNADFEKILLTGGGAGVFSAYLKRTRLKLKDQIALDDEPVYSNVRGFQIFGELQRTRAQVR